MNDLEQIDIVAPNGTKDTCAKFTIKETNTTFTIEETLVRNQKYVFHFWIRSDASGTINTFNEDTVTSTTWVEVIRKFEATSNSVVLTFKKTGVYYIYNAKLEAGGIPTSWTQAPEDIKTDISNAQNSADSANGKADANSALIGEAKTAIQQLKNAISTMVTDSNGSSLMTQTSDGWKFEMGPYIKNIEDSAKQLASVSGSVNEVNKLANDAKQLADDISKKTAYINMSTDESGSPCIELGKSDNEFKLRITNTSIDFMQGSNKIAYISNQKLYIQSSVVTDQMQIGDYDPDKGLFGFVWRKRENGNMGIRRLG